MVVYCLDEGGNNFPQLLPLFSGSFFQSLNKLFVILLVCCYFIMNAAFHNYTLKVKKTINMALNLDLLCRAFLIRQPVWFIISIWTAQSQYSTASLCIPST